MSKPRESLFLGYGFPWNAKYTQLLTTYLASEGALPISPDQAGGYPALHAVGRREERPVHLPLAELAGHVLVTGMTGSGKTKLLEVLTEEAVACAGATVVIDPKGSRPLMARCASAARRRGKPFATVLLASPAHSASMNVLETATTPAEVAARIKALMPPGAKDPFFREYPLALIENIAGAQQALGVPWTLEELYRPALFYDDLEYLAATYLAHLGYPPAKDKKTRRLQAIAYQDSGTKDLIADGLLEDLAHNREHFQKITSTLRPAFRGVIGEPLGRIFSPPPGAPESLTWHSIAAQSMVVYIGLASMLFPDIANRVGRVILQDLIGFLGRRYAYEDPASFIPITIPIDEVARVAYEDFPTALAMSREAGCRFILAQQSLADMEATLSHKAHARQIYENCNTRIWCRVSDETAKQASEGLPECTVHQRRKPGASHSYGDLGGLSGNASLTWDGRPVPIVALDWFTALPKGHAFVRMRGEVWKLRIPLLQDIPEPELVSLGLLGVGQEVKHLPMPAVDGELVEPAALPAPPRALLPEHTMTPDT